MCVPAHHCRHTIQVQFLRHFIQPRHCKHLHLYTVSLTFKFHALYTGRVQSEAEYKFSDKIYFLYWKWANSESGKTWFLFIRGRNRDWTNILHFTELFHFINAYNILEIKRHNYPFSNYIKQVGSIYTCTSNVIYNDRLESVP